jgi:hypothetical protein
MCFATESEFSFLVQVLAFCDGLRRSRAPARHFATEKPDKRKENPGTEPFPRKNTIPRPIHPASPPAGRLVGRPPDHPRLPGHRPDPRPSPAPAPAPTTCPGRPTPRHPAPATRPHTPNTQRTTMGPVPEQSSVRGLGSGRLPRTLENS